MTCHTAMAQGSWALALHQSGGWSPRGDRAKNLGPQTRHDPRFPGSYPESGNSSGADQGVSCFDIKEMIPRLMAAEEIGVGGRYGNRVDQALLTLPNY